MSDVPSSSMPFAIVMRGYDREQVNDYFKRVDADLRVLSADRDAAAANARELAEHLDDARDEIDALRAEIDKLSVPPTTAQGMSERISRMLQLASDEASEIRAQAESESAELLSVARQEADQMQREAEAEANEQLRAAREFERQAAERAEEMNRALQQRQAAMEAEHSSTMQSARNEAERITAAARAEADELDMRARQGREQVQHDFDVSMADKRERTIAEIDELERSSREEARQLRESAATEAERIQQQAQSIAIERLTQAKESVDHVRKLRTRMLTAISEIRDELAEVPTLLADDPTDRELLDSDPLTLLNAGLSAEAHIHTSHDSEDLDLSTDAADGAHRSNPDGDPTVIADSNTDKSHSRTAVSYR